MNIIEYNEKRKEFRWHNWAADALEIFHGEFEWQKPIEKINEEERIQRENEFRYF